MAKKPSIEDEEDTDVGYEEQADWFDGDDAEILEASFKDYDIVASPNDFNVNTILDFIDAGVVKIPAFQRNYVWDQKRASKLIESLLIGLPIPQVFLYEESRNSFLVIDGQQRLMSIYYFFKKRFPRKSQRPMLRRIFAEKGTLPDSILGDDAYFTRFNLSLPGTGDGKASRFHKKNVDTLNEYKTTLGLRTLRNIVIKQTAPDEAGDSSVFEIFNRLNTGGVNLRNQEIRTSLYHSPFFSMLERANLNPVWRGFLSLAEPDLHAKDIEILLRCFAMLIDGNSYTEPMSKFLNVFSAKSRKMPAENIQYLEQLWHSFFKATSTLPPDVFSVAGGRRFNIAAFEAVFRAACAPLIDDRKLVTKPLASKQLERIKTNTKFLGATRFGTGRAAYVATRFEVAAKELRRR